MDHRPQAWGRPRDDVYGSYDAAYMKPNGPSSHSQGPIVTGSSVVAIKFNGGVVIAADYLGSYGSLARYTDVKRLRPFAGTSVVGFSGDVADMQYLDRHLTELAIDEAYASEAGHSLNAHNLHTYLAKLLYHRRSKMDPLWNHVLVAGLDGAGAPFLAAANLLGTTFTSPSLATGMGSVLAQPILRRYAPDEEAAAALSQEDAIKAVVESLKVLFYRDTRALDRYSLAIVTKDGIDLREDQKLEKQSWAFADQIKGYGTQIV